MSFWRKWFHKNIDARALEVAKENGEALSQYAYAAGKREFWCNHRKGGYARRVGDSDFRLTNGSDASQYAVIKHMLHDGSWFIKCLRCGKEWNKDSADYIEAVKFPTNNISSSTVQFGFYPKEEKKWNWKRILCLSRA